MGSNWAEKFRRRIEESEGKYRPAENLDDVDEEEWKEEEEDAELEEPEDETEEVEQEEEGEEEAEEFEQEAEKPEIEKPLPAVETPKLSLDRQRFRQGLDNVLSGTTIQPAKTEVIKAEPAKPVKRETNELAVAGTAMIGLMALSLMPTFYQTMMQAFQPLVQSFQSLSNRSQSALAAGQEWVACPYCGYQCLGYNGMPCPRCGRS